MANTNEPLIRAKRASQYSVVEPTDKGGWGLLTYYTNIQRFVQAVGYKQFQNYCGWNNYYQPSESNHGNHTLPEKHYNEMGENLFRGMEVQ